MRSATGDLWTGVQSATSSPVAAAEATAGAQDGGAGSSVIAGLAILGLGLAGLTAGFVIGVGRRRKAGSTRHRTND